MPGTLVDRLPLPNLKVYTTGSVLVLSMAVYYALNATSDPNWRLNSTVQLQEPMAEVEEGDKTEPSVGLSPVVEANGTRNFTEQFVDVMTFMMQEPLCMWTLINISYCSLALFGFLIQRVVFGQLRVAEAQRVKDKFWNYVFYKFIFVFGVINVQYMDEVMLWCSWFTLVGFLHLLGQLCKDRFEYLSSSPNTGRWAHARLLSLLAGILTASLALLGVAFAWGLPAGRDTFAFMAAECVLVVVCALHVCARYALQLYEADVAGPLAYYTHLVFDSVSLVVELMHVVHMVVYSNMLVSMASLVLLMQLRHLLHELQARVRRHRLYTSLATHMSRNYPMASKEEVEKNQDNCAICWEPMKEARKLPCSHLFHNSCLCQWVQQDASCPTCRRALSAGTAGATVADALPGVPGAPGAPGPAPPNTPRALDEALPLARHPNHFFHFDGSRYVSWLPSFSVEVTRVRPEPSASLSAAHLDALARQVQQMFPQYGLSVVTADLANTRSADLTLENILEGRLAHLAQPAPTPEHSPTPAPTEVISRATHSGVGSDLVSVAYIHSADPTDEPSGSTSQPASTQLDDYSSEADAASGRSRFSRNASDREVSLRRRKEMLIASARRKYLEKMSTSPAQSARPVPPSAAEPLSRNS